MKKLFSILAIFLFALAATFAQSAGDKIISVENFNEPWIIGTWTIEAQVVGFGQNISEPATFEITGYNDASISKNNRKQRKRNCRNSKKNKRFFCTISGAGQYVQTT
ncbi:hypothetical protein [Treponema zioleckii]|uniref:hypothetical protein n=1 Tax=Treponema zioleckii TaxID=331680 RepID=UPI00168AA2EF|nr:hypothetical protein [Treponema zioleckii]